MKMRVRTFKDKAELTAAAVDALSSAITATVESRKPVGVMLSGGSTPMAVYEAIAASPLAAPKALHLFMSDERLVPFDSDKNNFHNTEPMFERLGLPAERLLRVKTDLPAKGAATDYHQQIDDFLHKRSSISLGFLGMGSDGHTASLFNDGDLARGKGKFATWVDRPDGMQGISVTPGLLNYVKHLVFLISGADKKEMVQCLINEPMSIPAGQAIQYCQSVELWLTEDAHA
ncbi:MAG: 6-phosphogluconolactonase [Candidatus Omnitrophota bacterium]|jgi:6-phosphogluconolactonase